jgi:hypothetical protein
MSFQSGLGGAGREFPQGHLPGAIQRARPTGGRLQDHRCSVSEYQALPILDANPDAIAIENIKLENEGGERDTDVTEPQD